MSTVWGSTSKALTRTFHIIPHKFTNPWIKSRKIPKISKDHICESQISLATSKVASTPLHSGRFRRSTTKVSTTNVHMWARKSRESFIWLKLNEIKDLLPDLEARSGWCHSQALEAIHNSSGRGEKVPVRPHMFTWHAASVTNSPQFGRNT